LASLWSLYHDRIQNSIYTTAHGSDIAHKRGKGGLMCSGGRALLRNDEIGAFCGAPNWDGCKKAVDRSGELWYLSFLEDVAYFPGDWKIVSGKAPAYRRLPDSKAENR
jgi:hypothetical protein